jgi:anti-anti-sigma regulatory factor
MQKSVSMLTKNEIVHRIREVAMTIPSRTVIVEQMPEISSMKQGRVFLREITSRMSSNRPQIVLDCSHVGQVEGYLIHVLLCCLEEAFKRNGDIALAALPSSGRAMLQRAGVDRVFALYETTNDAVNYFRRPADEHPGDVWSAA